MHKQKILILGGTQFIGRNLVEQLSSTREIELYLFNRQETNAQLFPHLKKIKGDRQTNDIKQIESIQWDYIIDVSCYYPADIKKTLSFINQDVKNYIFISTCSVYNTDLPLLAREENSPILECTESEAMDTTNTSYGQRKAECERILQSSGVNYSILRPALVFGAYDHSDRLYYWLHQIHAYDQLLVPNLGGSLFSVTYVKDLVKIIVALIKPQRSNEVYNVTSKIQFSLFQLISIAERILDKNVQKINAPSKFLKSENISQWFDMPLWLDCDYYTYDNSKIKNQLKFSFQQLESSIAETIEYYNSIHWPIPHYGISDEIKTALIQKCMLI